MKIGLSVTVLSIGAAAVVSDISVAVARPSYIEAKVNPATIIFSPAARPLVLEQTNLVSEAVFMGDGEDAAGGFAAQLTKALDVLKEEPDDVALPTDADPVFDAQPVFAETVTVTDAQIVISFDDIVDFDPSTPAVDFEPVSITEADAKEVTVAELADNDDVSITEAISNQPNIPKTDAVTATEVSTRQIQPAKSDTVAVTEAVDDFEVGKVLADAVSVTEAIANEVTFPTSDAVNAVQSNIKTFTSSVDFDLSDADVDPDPVTATDVIDDFDFNKGLADATTATETDVKEIAVGELADNDATSVVEAIALEPNSVLTDSFTAVEGIKLGPSIPKTDAVTAAEAIVHDIRPPQSDAVTATESVATILTLGDSEYMYPDFVSVSDGYRGFLEEPYSYTISGVAYYVPNTGVIGAAEPFNTAMLASDRITLPDASSAGLLVNFHYTDVDEDDRALGGYYFNQTPINAGNSTVGARTIL
jgi:hypothetical protein